MDRPTCQGNILYMVLPNASEHCDVCTTVPGIMKQESRRKYMAHTTTLTNSSNTQALSIHVASEPLKARTYYLAYSHHHTIPLSTLLSPQLELASSCVNYILGKHLDKTIPPLVFIKSCTYPSRPCTLQVYVISYNNVTVPCDVLHINVCPIYKKGTRKVPVNDRPISLTCIAYKLFEHIVIYKQPDEAPRLRSNLVYNCMNVDEEDHARPISPRPCTHIRKAMQTAWMAARQ